MVFIKSYKKLWIILSCIVLIVGAFGYGYYTTVGKISNEKPLPKPGTRIDFKNHIPPEEEEVNKIPLDDKVTPNTVLEKKIVSINTENQIIEYNDIVPDSLVNLTKSQIIDYFNSNGYNKVEYDNGKISAIKELPNLPDCYVIKLENNYITVYKTDSGGIATRYEEFDPIPYKNKDEKLEKGIEVSSEEQIYEKIQDYE